MTVLNVGHFAGFGVGQCPEIPQHWECERVPECPTGFPAQEKRKGAQIRAKAGRKFFSRSPIDTASYDRDVFDTANAICFARSKRKGEKECLTKRNNRTFRRRWPTTTCHLSDSAPIEALDILESRLMGLLQEPLFRRLEIRKCPDIYTSTPSHLHWKLLWIKSLWSANNRDFYPVARKTLPSFSHIVSILYP